MEIITHLTRGRSEGSDQREKSGKVNKVGKNKDLLPLDITAHLGGESPVTAVPDDDASFEFRRNFRTKDNWLSANDVVIYEGVLKIKSSRTVLGKHVWDKRFCALMKSSGMLHLFEQKRELVAFISNNRVLPHQTIWLDRIQELKKCEKRTRFDIVMEKGSYTFELEAMSKTECQRWISGIETYQKGSVRSLSDSVLSKIWHDARTLQDWVFTKYFANTAFEMLHDHELRSLASFFQVTHYPPGSVLFSPQNVGAYFYIVIDGEVRLYAKEPSGHSVYLCDFKQNDTIGVATIVEGKRIAEAHSEQGCTCLELREKDLDEFFSRESTRDAQDFIRLAMGYQTAELLSKVVLLKKIPLRLLRLIGALTRFVCLPKDATLFREGSLGASLYIVLRGSVKAFSVGEDGAERVLSTFNNHEVFGEISLLMAIPRTASIVALDDSFLLQLNKDEFSRVIEILPARCRVELQNVVKTRTAEQFRKYKVPFFEAIPEDKYEILAQLCELHTYPSGTVLFREGEMGTSFYLIVHGHCTVSVQKTDEHGNKHDEELSVMGPGKYFGEIALVQDSARTATVTCKTRSVILSISSDKFAQFFKEAPEALSDFELKLARHGVQLRSVLYHPVAIKYFERFLKEEFSDENIEFWKACRVYRHMNEHKVLKYRLEALVDEEEEDAEESSAASSSWGAAASTGQGPQGAQGSQGAQAAQAAQGAQAQQGQGQGGTAPPGGAAGSTGHPSNVWTPAPGTPATPATPSYHHRADPQTLLRELQAIRLSEEYFKLLSKAREIYDEFISPNALRQVNLLGATVERLNQCLQSGDIDEHTLDDASDEIQKLMSSDSFARFKNSPIFEEFLNTIQSYKNVDKVVDGPQHRLRSGSISSRSSRRSRVSRASRSRSEGRLDDTGGADTERGRPVEREPEKVNVRARTRSRTRSPGRTPPAWATWSKLPPPQATTQSKGTDSGPPSAPGSRNSSPRHQTRHVSRPRGMPAP